MNLWLWTWIPLTRDKEEMCEGMWRSRSCCTNQSCGMSRSLSTFFCFHSVYFKFVELCSCSHHFGAGVCNVYVCVCGGGQEHMMHVWMLCFLFPPQLKTQWSILMWYLTLGWVMHIHGEPRPGRRWQWHWGLGRWGCRRWRRGEACLSECVTFPDQRIFLIKVPYPFYHAYPRSD